MKHKSKSRVAMIILGVTPAWMTVGLYPIEQGRLVDYGVLK